MTMEICTCKRKVAFVERKGIKYQVELALVLYACDSRNTKKCMKHVTLNYETVSSITSGASLVTPYIVHLLNAQPNRPC